MGFQGQTDHPKTCATDLSPDNTYYEIHGNPWRSTYSTHSSRSLQVSQGQTDHPKTCLKDLSPNSTYYEIHGNPWRSTYSTYSSRSYQVAGAAVSSTVKQMGTAKTSCLE